MRLPGTHGSSKERRERRRRRGTRKSTACSHMMLRRPACGSPALPRAARNSGGVGEDSNEREERGRRLAPALGGEAAGRGGGVGLAPSSGTGPWGRTLRFWDLETGNRKQALGAGSWDWDLALLYWELVVAYWELGLSTGNCDWEVAVDTESWSWTPGAETVQ